jgi:MoaA/NifB/PqqE/SkfB family radical SAM enzyme
MLRRTVAVDMEQGENLLDMNDGETVRYIYNSKCKYTLICSGLLITHLLVTGLGIFSGLYLCQNGHVDCSYEDGSF